MARNDGVHHTVRRIDGDMKIMNNVLRKFGTPRSIGSELRGLKGAVGDVIAKMEMIERRR